MPGNAGRKPDPTVLRLLKGNPSKRPINKDEPKPRKGSISVPKHLDKRAKANSAVEGEEAGGICLSGGEARNAVDGFGA